MQIFYLANHVNAAPMAAEDDKIEAVAHSLVTNAIHQLDEEDRMTCPMFIHFVSSPDELATFEPAAIRLAERAGCRIISTIENEGRRLRRTLLLCRPRARAFDEPVVLRLAA